MKTKGIYYLLTLCLVVSSPMAYADADLYQAFSNTTKFWGSLLDLAFGISLISGMVFGGKALFELIEVSKSNGAPSSKSYTKAILYFLASAMLMSSLSYIHTWAETFSLGGIDVSSAGEIFATNTDVDDKNVTAAVDSMFLFIRLFGFCCTIKALWDLPKVTTDQADLSKLVVKFLAGIGLMYLLDIINIVSDTLGLGISF